MFNTGGVVMKSEDLVCKIEEYLNKKNLLEKRTIENRLVETDKNAKKRSENNDKQQGKVKGSDQ